MTTAHRPTWAPAKGSEDQGGARFLAPSLKHSAKDQAGQTRMKLRAEGQGSAAELERRQLKEELLAREARHFLEGQGPGGAGGRPPGVDPAPLPLPGSADERLAPTGALRPTDLDADESFSEDGSDSGDGPDEDDEAALMAELEKIKRERAAEQGQRDAEARALDEAERAGALAGGNPLLDPEGGDFAVKRRWDEDVVFRNQARQEPRKQRRFINDTVRNDFHKRFLNRYIR